MKQIIKVSSWVILLFSFGGMGVAGYLYFKRNTQANITPVQKLNSVNRQNGISRVNVMSSMGHENPAVEIDK